MMMAMAGLGMRCFDPFVLILLSFGERMGVPLVSENVGPARAFAIRLRHSGLSVCIAYRHSGIGCWRLFGYVLGCLEYFGCVIFGCVLVSFFPCRGFIDGMDDSRRHDSLFFSFSARLGFLYNCSE